MARTWAHYITITEGPLLPHLMYKLRFHYPKQSRTTFQYAQNGAIVAPVNDTRTQCTTSLPPIKERLSLDAQRMVKESHKIKAQNRQRVGPTPTKASINTVVVAPVHNL